MPIQWREQLSIDGGMIDQDHKTLFAIINRFEAVQAGLDAAVMLNRVLNELERYAAEHFRREQQLQRKVAYPYAQAHGQQHAELMRNVALARAEFAAATSRGDLAIFREHMSSFLHDWLLDHIIRNDLLMKPYVKAMAAHAAQIGDLHAAVRRRARGDGANDDARSDGRPDAW